MGLNVPTILTTRPILAFSLLCPVCFDYVV